MLGAGKIGGVKVRDVAARWAHADALATRDLAALLATPLPVPEPLRGPLVVYGAGKTGREVHRLLAAEGFDVLVFLDSFARPGQAWDGLPVLLPEAFAATGEAGLTTAVVAIHNRDAELPPVFARLRTLGFARAVGMVELYRLYPDQPDRYWLCDPARRAGDAERILAVRDRLADATSRLWLDRVVAFRRTGAYELLPPHDAARPYRPADVPRWPEPIRFVDGGAFDGDTLAAFLDDGYRVSAAACFEPDPGSFAALSARARTLSASCDVRLFPAGLGAAAGRGRVEAGLGEASRVSDAGGLEIAVVALDDVLPDFRPTLVKLDVEGAEADALAGARSVIRDCRPALAVCVYHRPSDLWEIPEAIDAWGLGYRLYLRGHGYASFDFVLYALPS